LKGSDLQSDEQKRLALRQRRREQAATSCHELTAVFFIFEFENQVEYLKLHRAKLEKAQLVFGWRVAESFIFVRKKNCAIRWPNDA